MAPRLVLVVDDDFLVRMNTAQTFEEAEFEVIEADDAASALKMLEEQSGIELLCTDIHMPGELDGLDLAIRVQEQRPDTKVIVISGLIPKRALPPGIPFLSKPFLSGRLVDLARKQLGVSV